MWVNSMSSRSTVLQQAKNFTAQGNQALEAGDEARAEVLFKQALEAKERELGSEHQGIANDLDNLASVYQDQARYADAEPLYKRSLAILEKARGRDDPDVAAS